MGGETLLSQTPFWQLMQSGSKHAGPVYPSWHSQKAPWSSPLRTHRPWELQSLLPWHEGFAHDTPLNPTLPVDFFYVWVSDVWNEEREIILLRTFANSRPAHAVVSAVAIVVTSSLWTVITCPHKITMAPIILTHSVTIALCVHRTDSLATILARPTRGTRATHGRTVTHSISTTFIQASCEPSWGISSDDSNECWAQNERETHFEFLCESFENGVHDFRFLDCILCLFRVGERLSFFDS